ncbi:MAG: mechanosensitive ion channel family protein [Magnetovibrio sp.]|nr:mechanosensitive ion channel family protein [Magnetovibrio sp.]
MQLDAIFDKLLGNQVISSIVLIGAVIVLRVFVHRFLRARKSIDADQRRRIDSNVKNALLLLVGVGLLFIWAPALRTFALSLTAFAVAIILATKEVILCVSGALVKATSGSMRVGDWIAVDGIRGEVTDQSLMSTSLQELGHGPLAYEFTGRTIVLPNSVFLAEPVTNEQFYKRYVIHSFALVTEADVDPDQVKDAMLEAVHAEMSDIEEVTRRYKAMIENRASIDLPDIDAAAHVSTTAEGRLRIVLRCFLPTKSAIAIEQAALKAGLRSAAGQRAASG